MFLATGVSIAGNAIHATLNTTSVPAALAAAVATVPPLVLLASTEGVSMLVRAHRSSSAAYWCALAMTALLAVCAFVLSFDALQDLATRAGIRAELAWLWPIAVDASIAQCTVALLSLSRDRAPAELVSVSEDSFLYNEFHDSEDGLNLVAGVEPDDVLRRVAKEIIEDGSTKQSPEVIAEILQRSNSGQRPSQVAQGMKLHHSTVNRVLNEAHKRTLQTEKANITA
ncbi:DUF2637 domain-containing protein [Mycobacteroides abscessus]|uniref:DUF2637 domain-containing protein n=1 Tax=Mycobacteroides abscessus TaxID=36809 RepID=UPI0013FCF722|nr:DUF2637 domain-containing protein [Mycobacteroides abscessus]